MLWGPYDGLVRPARAAGPRRTPPHGGGHRAPQRAQDAAVLSAALRDSFDDLFSPLYDRLSLIGIGIMPYLQAWRSGEVSSYLELINWLLRKYADEGSLSDPDSLFHGAAQEADETEIDSHVRLQGLRRLCGYIHTEG